jgi:hypothetical protein
VIPESSRKLSTFANSAYKVFHFLLAKHLLLKLLFFRSLGAGLSASVNILLLRCDVPLVSQSVDSGHGLPIGLIVLDVNLR